MPKFLYYGVKIGNPPPGVNQLFGANPAYYAKFLDDAGNPEKGHTGIDFTAPHATPLYAECDGNAFYASDAHGGDGIYIHTVQNGQPYYVINWHLCSKDDPQFKPLIPTDGTWVGVKAGQLIGYTDNTGAPYESSGDHLHFGLIPLTASNTPIAPNNGFNGCVDPIPYFTGFFAQDIPTIIATDSALVVLLKKLLTYLQK